MPTPTPTPTPVSFAESFVEMHTCRMLRPRDCYEVIHGGRDTYILNWGPIYGGDQTDITVTNIVTGETVDVLEREDDRAVLMFENPLPNGRWAVEYVAGYATGEVPSGLSDIVTKLEADLAALAAGSFKSESINEYSYMMDERMAIAAPYMAVLDKYKRMRAS